MRASLAPPETPSPAALEEGALHKSKDRDQLTLPMDRPADEQQRQDDERRARIRRAYARGVEAARARAETLRQLRQWIGRGRR